MKILALANLNRYATFSTIKSIARPRIGRRCLILRQRFYICKKQITFQLLTLFIRTISVITTINCHSKNHCRNNCNSCFSHNHIFLKFLNQMQY